MNSLSAYINASDLLKVMRLPKNFLHKKLRIIIEPVHDENPNINKPFKLGSMAKFSKITGDIISPIDTEWEALKS